MNKKIAKLVVIGLALVSIAVIALVSFSPRLNAAYYRGVWVYKNGQVFGCAGTGDQCTWGTPDPNPSPDN